MVTMFETYTRSVWFLAITLLTSHRSAGQPSQLIICGQPDSFTVQITEDENVVVYGTELLIRHNPYPAISPFAGTDEINVVFNESTIEFRGYALPNNSVSPQESPKRLSWVNSGIILATGTLQKPTYETYITHNCRLLLSKDIEGSASNLPLVVENEITHHARNCVETRMCQSIRTIRPEELEDINERNELDFDAQASRTIVAYEQVEKQPNCCATGDVVPVVNLNVNAPVDIAVKIAVNYIKDHDKSRIKIPDVNEQHVLGPFGVTCHFRAVNGTFEDFSTLRRTGDAFVSAAGQTHILNAGFGLSTAKFSYGYYKLDYGVVSIKGKITGNIDGVALTANIILDYEQPCPVSVTYIRVSEIGEIKIKMTGLGVIDNLTSAILSWLSNMWQRNIASFVEISLKHIVQKQLSEFICDIYKNVTVA